MKAPNITRGEWLKNGLVVSGPIGDRIADCNASTGKADAEKEANACAIAAIPELLTALEIAHRANSNNFMDMKFAVQAALVKAGYTF